MMRADFRKPAFVLFLGLTLVLLSPALLGATYHVATDGLDSNPGTEAAPWLSLQHAVDSVAPGDEILVHAGSYPGARVENSGAPGAYITLRAADGEAVLLDAPAAGHKHDSILEVETWDSPGVVSYWAIEGFEISGAGRSGIDLRVTHHVIVRGNRVHDSGLTGIFTAFSDDLLIEANESHANGEHGIYTSNSGDRPTLSGNLLHGNHAAGIHMNADLSQGGDGVISDALVERNIIFGNGVGGGSGINMDGVSNSIVRNNLIYDEHASGISLFQQDGAVCSSDNLVANNTVLVAADGRWAMNMPDGGCTGNQVFNNVFHTSHDWRGAIAIASPSPAGFASDYNVVMDRLSIDGGDSRITFAEWQALGHGAHSFIATPDQLFIDPAGGDHHPAPGSPVIDAGAMLTDVPDDLEGRLRPQGAAWDIGAYEVPVAACIDDADCDDGLYCNGAEACDEGVCVAGADPCPGQSCDELIDLCFDPVCDDNGVCETGEDCSNCPSDCIAGGGGGGGCGNGICETGLGEDCLSCAADCRDKQNGKASRRFCCGAGGGQNPVGCEDPRCSAEGFACSDSSAELFCCGDAVCEGAENSCSCGLDCGAAPDQEIPGLSCDDGEDNDCDGDIDCADADCTAAAACQPPACDGDGVCEAGEDCRSCGSDCSGRLTGKPSNRYCCGDGIAQPPEGGGALCDGNF